jgi:hypothetical protein
MPLLSTAIPKRNRAKAPRRRVLRAPAAIVHGLKVVMRVIAIAADAVAAAEDVVRRAADVFALAAQKAAVARAVVTIALRVKVTRRKVPSIAKRRAPAKRMNFADAKRNAKMDLVTKTRMFLRRSTSLRKAKGRVKRSPKNRMKPMSFTKNARKPIGSPLNRADANAGSSVAATCARQTVGADASGATTHAIVIAAGSVAIAEHAVKPGTNAIVRSIACCADKSIAFATASNRFCAIWKES